MNVSVSITYGIYDSNAKMPNYFQLKSAFENRLLKKTMSSLRDYRRRYLSKDKFSVDINGSIYKNQPFHGLQEFYDENRDYLHIECDMDCDCKGECDCESFKDNLSGFLQKELEYLLPQFYFPIDEEWEDEYEEFLGDLTDFLSGLRDAQEQIKSGDKKTIGSFGVKIPESKSDEEYSCIRELGYKMGFWAGRRNLQNLLFEIASKQI